MKFYKERIGILKENTRLELIGSGENIPLESQNIDFIFQQMF